MDKKTFKEVAGKVFKKNGFKYGKKYLYLEDDQLRINPPGAYPSLCV